LVIVAELIAEATSAAEVVSAIVTVVPLIIRLTTADVAAGSPLAALATVGFSAFHAA